MAIRILLSGKSNLENYIEATERAGAIAVAKYLPEIDTSYDGLVLCGGVDVHPCRYNDEINGSVDIDEKRDQCEFSLLKAFLDAGKPVFGICRGCQLINVYFGGTLYQHMFNTVLHRSGAEEAREHEVVAVPGSLPDLLYGRRFIVNSIHHQGIKNLGEGLSVTMYSDDGIVEGIVHNNLPVFAVQWHPERLVCPENRRHAVDGVKLFEHFIDICKEKQR